MYIYNTEYGYAQLKRQHNFKAREKREGKMQQGSTALAGREAEAHRAHVQASLFIVTEDWKQKKMTHLCEEALKGDLQMKRMIGFIFPYWLTGTQPYHLHIDFTLQWSMQMKALSHFFIWRKLPLRSFSELINV